jgi:Ca2+-binding RTX toxin-like protein
VTFDSFTLRTGCSVEFIRAFDPNGTAPIKLTGNEFSNNITGNRGDNAINGGGGADTMTGGAGNDTYQIDNTGDVVNELANNAIVTPFSFTLQPGASIEILRTYGSATTTPINLTGNEGFQIIFGNAAANTLDGRGGSDRMTGNDGDDRYFIDNAGDEVVEFTNQGTDTVIAATSYSLAAGSAVEILRTFGSATLTAINLFGNELANNVQGNNGPNLLAGRAGNDIIFTGGDTDAIRFDTALSPSNIDTIVDFSVVLDTIQLDDAVFAGLPTGTLAAGAFRIGAAAQDADDRILYDGASGSLRFDPDGSGGGGASVFAVLSTGLALTNNDFVVV